VVIPAEKTSPVLGFVSRKADESWSIERSGKILPALYSSADEAARALIVLAREK